MNFPNEANEALSTLLNVLFYILIFISLIYGTKIKIWKSAREIKEGLNKVKKWNEETRQLTISKFKESCDSGHSLQDIEKKIDEYLNFITIPPVELDPYGLIPKIEHILNTRELKYLSEVRDLANTADESQIFNLEKLLEVASAVHMLHRLLLHYYILGKKFKSHMFLEQIKIQLPLLLVMAKAYVSASKSFAEGSPIGDALGPMVVAKLVREITQGNPPAYEDITNDTILQRITFENRNLLLIRAKGPGGTTGKPGTAIKEILESHTDEIVRIITIDAGIKLEGDQTGTVVTGVGAAIGGFGVEKSKIEDISTKNQIPMDALICRQSLEDAICTMKKSILDSVPIIIEKTKALIRRNTKENQSIIIAGIGNTIGVGI
jgi:hypothetical protein